MAVHLVQRKVQQSDVQTGAPKDTARERGTERDIGRMFKMLREEESMVEYRNRKDRYT